MPRFLNLFQVNVLLQYPLKTWETRGFLLFSGDTEMKNWYKIGYCTVKPYHKSTIPWKANLIPKQKCAHFLYNFQCLPSQDFRFLSLSLEQKTISYKPYISYLLCYSLAFFWFYWQRNPLSSNRFAAGVYHGYKSENAFRKRYY